jgi:hypothetical protein
VQIGREVKVKFTLEQAIKAHEGSRGIALFFNHGTKWGVGGQHHALATLHPGKRPGTHCTGGWVGPGASLDGCGKSRPPYQDLIPGLSST